MRDLVWNSRWIAAYGFPRQPAPIARSTLLVGGPLCGKHMEVPYDSPVVRFPEPVTSTVGDFEAETLPSVEHEWRHVLYGWRTFVPHVMASPVRVLVHQGTSDDEAAAVLYQGWM